MIEIWYAKTRAAAREQGQRLRWLRNVPPGIWIAIAVLALLGWRMHWVKAQRSAHREEIAAAFGSESKFFGVPLMNQDGSKVVYVATDDRGYGLVMCDTATGRKQIVREGDVSDRFGDALYDIRVWAWSPDGGSFIYSMQHALYVCPADTNQPPVKLTIGADQPSSVIWLNPSEFAWLEGDTICHATKPAGGNWTIQKLPDKHHISSLTALDTHTIGWLQEDFICHLDLRQDFSGTNSPFKALGADAYAPPLTNNLVLWLDASTLQQSNQTSVADMEDLSIKKNLAVANHHPPVFNAPGSPDALNGKGTLHFESDHGGTNASGLKTLKRLGIIGVQPRSVFAVMRREARGSMQIAIGNAATNGGFFGISDQSDALYLPSGGFRGNNDGKLGRLPESWHILELVYDGEECRRYVNGGSSGSAKLPFFTADREVEIGLRTAGRQMTNAAASDGDFAELLIYNRALSFAKQRDVEGYLGLKWFGRRPLSPENSLVWLDPQVSGVTDFSYSKDTGRLLLNRTENGRDSLWRMETGAGVTAGATQILDGRFLRDAQWTGLREFAYTSRELNHPGLVLADLSGGERARLFPKANISWFRVTPDQKEILLFGSLSNEPAAGIWRYDLATAQLREVVAGADSVSPLARNREPTHASIRLPSGRSVNCTIYFPPNADRHKKYPLLLGNTYLNDAEYRGKAPVWAPAIAACGAYVVIVERGDWWGGLDRWEENVMGVYHNLAQNPCIDTMRVFVFGSSAETQNMSQCLEKAPGLWRGAFFLNPSELPDFSKSPMLQSRPRILISAGSEEHEERRFKKYQSDALNAGALVEVVIHPGEFHHLVGNAAERERTCAMMHFIFEE